MKHRQKEEGKSEITDRSISFHFVIIFAVCHVEVSFVVVARFHNGKNAQNQKKKGQPALKMSPHLRGSLGSPSLLVR